MKGVAERGLGQDKRKRWRGEREEEKVRVRDTATTKFRNITPNYLPMESTTHTPKNIFHSIFNTMYSQKYLSFTHTPKNIYHPQPPHPFASNPPPITPHHHTRSSRRDAVRDRDRPTLAPS